MPLRTGTVLRKTEIACRYGGGTQREFPSVPAAQNGTLGNRTDTSEHTGTMDADSPDIIAVLADQVALLKSPLESDLFSLPSCEPVPDSGKLS